MKIPDYPRKGVPVESTVRQMIDYMKAITLRGKGVKQSASGTTIDVNQYIPPQRRQKDTLPPFWPVLGSEGEGEAKTYYVTITDGYVNERIPGGEDDALAKHYPDGLVDGTGAREKHTVVAGKQVSLVVEVDEDGAITASGEDAATRIEIEDVDPESTHYEPKIGDASTGEPGIYRYCLAKIVAGEETGDPPKIERVLAGSHVSHFRELPKLINLPEASAADVGRLIKEYDKPSNEYRLRSIAKGDGQLRVTEEADEIQVRGNGKGLIVRYQVDGESAVDVAEFEDGLTTTGADAPAEKTVVTIPIPAASALPDDGWWGTLLWEHFVNITDSTPYAALELTVENGRVMAVSQQLPGGSMTAVTGTEGTPGSAAVASFATP